MDTKVVKIVASVYASQKSGENYRVYVNNTLMTERTFIWSEDKNYIDENIVINAPPGEYSVYVTPASSFEIRKLVVDGVDHNNDTIVIK
jgi:hypothetical protein